MSRDPSKLEAFVLADDLVVELYRLTRGFPAEERYGLQAQVRRAAVSVAANLVEGCSRRSTREYLHFVDIALGSASEVRYLLRLAGRLGFIDDEAVRQLGHGYGRVVRALQGVLTALTNPKPEARSPRPRRSWNVEAHGSLRVRRGASRPG